MIQSTRNYLMNAYFKRKVETFKPKYRFSGTSQADFKAWKSALLQELKAALGPMPVPVALNPEVIYEFEDEHLIKRRVAIDLEDGISAIVVIYIPKSALKKPAPAILCCHGHGKFAKDSVMGVRIDNYPEREAEINQFNYDYGLQMAMRGYVTAAIDWRGFGERSEGNVFDGRDECNINFIKTNLLGYNLLAMDIFDGMRCLDYLCTLDCVDSQNIGCMGLSFGGTMTTWISILDDRIKAADIIGYSCLLAEFALKRNCFCGSQMFFNQYALCDVPDLHGLIAPRPLLAEIGLQDQCFKADEALGCAEEVKKIYRAAGVSENYDVDIFDGGHGFAANKAFDFFDKHLKKD